MPTKQTKNTKMTGEKTAKKTVSPSRKKAETGMSAPLVDTNGKEVGTISLPKELFDVKGSDMLIAQYVRVYLANQRQGTRSTKTRSEIVGSTRKIYRQKGTGRARHGASKAPIFVGGGVTFGPKPTDFSMKLNKKQRRKAFLYVLSKRFTAGDMIFVKNLPALEPKTKKAMQMLKNLSIPEKNKSLLVYESSNAEGVVRAGRNLANLDMRSAQTVNAYDLAGYKKIIMAREAVEYLTTRFQAKKSKNEN